MSLKRPERLRRPRLLPIVTLCLSGTILLKSAGLIDAAFAQTNTGTRTISDQQRGHETATADDATATRRPGSKRYWPIANWTDKPPPPPLCKPDPLNETGERKILLHLKQRAEELDARAIALDRREQELDAAKAALRKQVIALKPLAAKLEAIHAAHQKSDNRKWTTLVSTYETMEPRSAARIFDGLNSEIVFNVLKRMNSRKSAQILANMRPDKAEVVTEKLAGILPISARSQPVAALLPDDAP